MLQPETTALLTAMANYPVTLPSEALIELVGRLPRLQGSVDLHLPEAAATGAIARTATNIRNGARTPCW